MNLVRYSTICLVCATVFLLSGCAQNRISVVNTNSGIVIHSEDYNYLNQHDTNKQQKELPKTTGNVIHLGHGYESIDLPPLNRF